MTEMAASVTRWMIENAYLVPFWFALFAAGALWEKRRIDQRIDAVIYLLKRQGIDIFDRSRDVDFE